MMTIRFGTIQAKRSHAGNVTDTGFMSGVLSAALICTETVDDGRRAAWKTMKYNRGIEQCEYCDISYHPMTRWSNESRVIFVHHLIFDIDFNTTFDDKCIKIAQENGYQKREDLTPLR